MHLAPLVQICGQQLTQASNSRCTKESQNGRDLQTRSPTTAKHQEDQILVIKEASTIESCKIVGSAFYLPEKVEQN